MRGANPAGGTDAVTARHAQVGEQDVRGVLGDHRDGLVAVAGRADDLDAGQQPQQGDQPVADDRLVVGEHHAQRVHAG